MDHNNKDHAETLKDITKVLSNISDEYLLISVDKSNNDNVKVFSRFSKKTLLLRLLPLMHQDLEKKFLKDKCKGKGDESTCTPRSEESEDPKQEDA